MSNKQSEFGENHDAIRARTGQRRANHRHNSAIQPARVTCGGVEIERLPLTYEVMPRSKHTGMCDYYKIGMPCSVSPFTRPSICKTVAASQGNL